MRFTQRIILKHNPNKLIEFPPSKKKKQKQNKTAEGQLWRLHTREFNTDLQWLGLSNELKTVSFQWDTA